MIICGIDPGKTGAIARINTTNKIVTIYDMPLNTQGDFIDCKAIFSLFQGADEIWIERVHARRTDGRSSLAGFMTMYGGLRATAKLSSIPTKLILPQKWKKVLGLLGTNKKASNFLAAELYPQIAEKVKRVKDHNRAEAVLIAHYGMLYNENLRE